MRVWLHPFSTLTDCYGELGHVKKRAVWLPGGLATVRPSNQAYYVAVINSNMAGLEMCWRL